MTISLKGKTGTDGDNKFRGTNRQDVYDGLGGDDQIMGFGGNDILNGGKGSDDIYGGAGNDKINGGSGVDFIWGDMGADILTGGKGGDYFRFIAAGVPGFGSQRDTVTDFTVSGVNKDVFWISTSPILDIDTFADLEDHMRMVGKDTHITFGSGDEIILRHVNMDDLSASNFAWIPFGE
jgi:Ca2+-binding RTX toxin-like protein